MYKKVFITLTIALTIMLSTGCGINAGNNVHIDERSISAFDSVSVNTSSANIELIASDQYGLEILAPERVAPEWNVTNGRLTILEKTRPSFINLNFFSNYYVKVYYPAETGFNEINLQTSSGSMKLPKVDVTNLFITSSSGNVNAIAENFNDAIIDTKSGNIVFSGDGNNISLKTSSGTIQSDINDCDAILAKTHSGSITLTGKGDTVTALTASTSSGSINADGVAWRDIDANTSSGSISISGELRGNTSAKTSSGSIKISVNGNPSGYGYTLTPSSGSIYWDGKKMGKPAILSGSFENNITADTSSGDIRVDFIGH